MASPATAATVRVAEQEATRGHAATSSASSPSRARHVTQWLLKRRVLEPLEIVGVVLLHNLLFLRTTLFAGVVYLGLCVRALVFFVGQQLHAVARSAVTKEMLSRLGDVGLDTSSSAGFALPLGSDLVDQIRGALALAAGGRRRTRMRLKRDPSVPCPLATTEILPALVMDFLDLEDRGALACACSAAADAWHSPFLWRELVVPLHYDTLNGCIERMPDNLPVRTVIRMWPEVFDEGLPRDMSFGGLWCDRVRGVRIDKCVHVIGTRAAGGAPGTVLRSTEGDAVQVVPGGEGSIIEDVAVEATRFACHAVSVHAGDVTLRRVDAQATGMNGIGVLVKNEAKRVIVEDCDLHDCRGCGSMLSYGAGPVTFRRSRIERNGWSGVGMFAATEAVFEDATLEGNKLYAIGAAQDADVECKGATSMEGNRCGDVHRYLATQLHHGYHISGHYI
mmetsp:Transcript_14386/g.43173  ORF Transcript_14386/g.43173 Transcript_14386/m.43173 type:complete len:449 (-) Transcript_14386:460-1806(-)